jgi:tRNA(fMet)-specific endonuclease VapC
MNGRANAVELVDKLADSGMALSTFTWGEIYERLMGSPVTAAHVRQFDEFTDTVDVIAPDVEIARQYAGIRFHLRPQGLLIPDNDLWIASTALAHNLTLVCRDNHFSRIPNLKLYHEA